MLSALCTAGASEHDVCGCAQVLSQGFKQHLGWCKGTRQEAQDRRGSEGEEDVEDEDAEDEGHPQELAAIDASKVLTCPISSLAQQETALLQDDLHHNSSQTQASWGGPSRARTARRLLIYMSLER